MKVCVVGNSVGFKVRPPRQAVDDLTYSELLQRDGHEVRNVSKAGVMLAEQFGLLDDDVITYFPDVVILHHGIIEVFHRQTVRRWNNAAILNQYRNQVAFAPYRGSSPWSRSVNLGWRAVNGVTRRIAGLTGRSWQWQSTQAFLQVMRATSDLLLKETPARLFVVGITPPAPKAELDLPGLTQSIAHANDGLRQLCLDLGARAEYVDVPALLRGHAHEELVPDGIHFSALGHRLLAQVLIARLAAPSRG